jgi:hypothetical protein
VTLDASSLWAVYAVVAVLFGVVCSLIYQRKGGSASAGFAFGALLGLIGLVIVTLSNPRKVDVMNPLIQMECPHCHGRIVRGLRVCPYCRYQLPSDQPPPPPPPPPLH